MPLNGFDLFENFDFLKKTVTGMEIPDASDLIIFSNPFIDALLIMDVYSHH